MISLFLDFINNYYIDSALLFLAVFFAMFAAAYLGKKISTQRTRNETVIDDEAKIILGAILSLLGLLIGFILTISINGYNARFTAEEEETITILQAYQRSELLPEPMAHEAQILLLDYLNTRIQFFNSGLSDDNSLFATHAFDQQNQLIDIAKQAFFDNPNFMISSVFTAYSDLYASQQQTQANWRHFVPNAAWILLTLFAITANALLGYHIRGIKGKNTLMMITPFLTALALFMIAEIDTPGEGIIHITPYNLTILNERLMQR